jgi:hypothetical protein
MYCPEMSTSATEVFGSCELGDKRKRKRLITIAQRIAANPSASFPNQTDTWGDLKQSTDFSTQARSRFLRSPDLTRNTRVLRPKGERSSSAIPRRWTSVQPSNRGSQTHRKRLEMWVSAARCTDGGSRDEGCSGACRTKCSLSSGRAAIEDKRNACSEHGEKTGIRCLGAGYR